MSREYEALVGAVCPEGRGGMAISPKARHDLAVEIYDACVGKKTSRPAAISSMHATWLPMLRAAMLHTSGDVVSADQWVDGLATAMAVSGVEWTPGSHRGRMTCARVIRLGGAVVSKPALAARPGSLKRAAIEASQQLEAAAGRSKKAKRRVIGFGCQVPFERLPRLVEDGFERLGRIFEKGDRRILDHYQAARNLLESCLGDPLYDLMMMLTLTVAASSVTPQVAPESREFSAAAKRKEPELLAANMVTRMLWFMRPQSFPWDADEKGVLRVTEMTKKIGERLEARVLVPRLHRSRTQGRKQPRAKGARVDRRAGSARQPAE